MIIIIIMLTLIRECVFCKIATNDPLWCISCEIVVCSNCKDRLILIQDKYCKQCYSHFRFHERHPEFTPILISIIILVFMIMLFIIVLCAN